MSEKQERIKLAKQMLEYDKEQAIEMAFESGYSLGRSETMQKVVKDMNKHLISTNENTNK